MVFKLINATDAKVGINIMVDGIACTVKSMDVSKTGKHGHAKCRIECVGIINNQKKVFVVPGHERFEVPLIEKKKAQVLAVGEKMSVMDLESFETIEVECPEEMRNELREGDNVEYWDVEGQKVIKRKM
jgi:translation initiation factor 5A